MKGWRFYLEYPSRAAAHKATVKRPDGHAGNVVAVFVPEEGPSGRLSHTGDGSARWLMEAVGAVLFRPNSPVAGTEVAREYLDERCKRIPEALARDIHPELFRYLDED